jgi:hypothetical protein
VRERGSPPPEGAIHKAPFRTKTMPASPHASPPPESAPDATTVLCRSTREREVIRLFTPRSAIFVLSGENVPPFTPPDSVISRTSALSSRRTNSERVTFFTPFIVTICPLGESAKPLS